MTLAPSSSPPSVAAVPAPARARPAASLRLVLGGAGLLVLLAGLPLTLGTALAAPLGMLVVYQFAHRRRRRLTLRASWLGGVAGSALACAVLFVVVLARLPAGTWANVQAQAQAAQKTQPPEWLERLSPGAAKGAGTPDPFTAQLIQSPAFIVITGAGGGLLAVSLWGTAAGTVGWGASLLLAFAATGRWPARRQASESPVDDEVLESERA